MKRIPGIVICLSMLVPLSGQGQIIMCKDASGRTYTSDRPIPECNGRALRQFGRSGTVVREISAPPTEEQRRQKALEEEKQRELRRAMMEQKRMDHALLTAYSNEDAIRAAWARSVDPLNERMATEKEALARAQQKLTDAKGELEKNRNAGDATEYNLKRKVEDAERAVKYRTSKIMEVEGELNHTNNKYEAALKRFRELTNDSTLPQSAARR